MFTFLVNMFFSEELVFQLFLSIQTKREGKLDEMGFSPYRKKTENAFTRVGE
jgi:hypothetical protein